ncbi:MAG TPA: IS3 family transposase [Candidatus Eisenbacteria bacterium]
MPRTHPPYPPEFRTEAVRLVRSGGKSLAAIARDLGVTHNTLRAWAQQTRIDEGLEPGLTTDERDELRRLRRENRQLKLEREILGKSRGLVRAGDRLDPVRGFEFVSAHQAVYPIAAQCQVLGVSTSGYYAWRQRAPSARAVANAALQERIRAIHTRSRETYGTPRVQAELAAAGERVSRKRIARLMRGLRLVGVSRRKATRTTRRADGARPAPDLVERDFAAPAADRLWVADITYVPIWAGFLYLAVVLDAFSRRVIGWSMTTHLRTELVLDALEMALWQRRPEAVIHHSDQGCQYTSIAFGQRCREAGVRPSMGSVGDAYDNALCESFFATLECELLDRHRFRTQAEARMAIFEFIEAWYNPHRRHSALGYLSPVDYEQNRAAAFLAA